jgi:hypothetical protein
MQVKEGERAESLLHEIRDDILNRNQTKPLTSFLIWARDLISI